MADTNSNTNGSMRDFAGIAIGLVLIAVGVVFFLTENFDIELPRRWWAAFILIPAGGSLVAATRFYRADGRPSQRMFSAATAGGMFLATALIFFFDLEWGRVWPVMPIILGAGFLAAGLFRR